MDGTGTGNACAFKWEYVISALDIGAGCGDEVLIIALELEMEERECLR